MSYFSSDRDERSVELEAIINEALATRVRQLGRKLTREECRDLVGTVVIAWFTAMADSIAVKSVVTVHDHWQGTVRVLH